MSRRTIGLISSTLLLPVTLWVAATGFVSDALDLNEFIFHKYVGYVMAVLVVIHVTAYWPSLAAFLTGRGGRRSRPGAITRAPAAETAPAPEMVPVADRVLAADAASDAAPTAPPSHGPASSPRRGIPRRSVLAVAGAGATGLAAGWLIRPGEVGRRPGEDLGALYHRASSPGYTDALGALIGWGGQPAPTKEYPGAPRFALPPVTPISDLSVAAEIEQRRSLRDYEHRPLTAGEMSWLLHSASGITDPRGLRAAPSAGAQYPIETYVVVTRVEGLEPGIYHYAPGEHDLALVRSGSFGGEIMLAGLGQGFIGQAPIVVVLSSIFQRLRWRYRERAYRYALIEAGHIAQNVYLAAEAAGLGTCNVSAFFDDDVNGMLGIDGVEEAALVLLPVGPR